MIVCYLDINRPWRATRPREANPPLVIDADAVLVPPAALEDLQPVAGQCGQVFEAKCLSARGHEKGGVRLHMCGPRADPSTRRVVQYPCAPAPFLTSAWAQTGRLETGVRQKIFYPLPLVVSQSKALHGRPPQSRLPMNYSTTDLGIPKITPGSASIERCSAFDSVPFPGKPRLTEYRP